MTKIARIGIDTSKSVFQLHGVDENEVAVLRRKVRRQDLLAYLGRLEPTTIGLEACGASHHWGREIRKLGHEAMLLPTQYTKAYVRRNKNDAADADAVCEAMSRPRVVERQVPIKSVDQTTAQMLMGLRGSLIERRTKVSNTIRGHAAEFGLVVAKGLNKIGLLLANLAHADIPVLAKEMFAMLGQEFAEVNARIAAIEKKVLAMHRGNELSRRLAEVPAIGPVGASLLVTKIVNPRGFRSGRMCAAWIGLTPKDHSTAGKQKLGGITRAGDESLRAVLVCGATAYIQQVRRGRIKQPSPWLVALLKRKPPKLAAVALANKTARIAWKLMVSGERYDAARAEGRGARTATPPTAPGMGFEGMRGSTLMPAEDTHGTP
jgi:transposase